MLDKMKNSCWASQRLTQNSHVYKPLSDTVHLQCWQRPSISAQKQGSMGRFTCHRSGPMTALSPTLDFERTALSDEVEQDNKHNSFDWNRQWYPLGAIRDLNPSRPTSAMLLGRKLVIWRDVQKEWRCFEDVCPHRKVPLSEGRIEESDGSLMCGYHGWRFSGDGKPTYIPQVSAVDKVAEESVLGNQRACARVHPTQVQQGLLFVWGESGQSAEAESAAVAPAVNGLMDELQEDFTYNYETFARFLQGGMEIWMENSMDQSHTSFAHHKIGGQKRGGKLEGYFKFKGSQSDPASVAFQYQFSLNGEALVDAATVFKPPCLLELSIEQSPNTGLWIYCVPVSKHCTLLIINSGGRMPQRWQDRLLGRIPFMQDFTRAQRHLRLHDVTSGDAVFMHEQFSNVVRHNPDPVKRWSNVYMLPGDNDRGVSLWIKWLVNEAGGGPSYGPDTVHQSMWDDSGRLKRRQLLDRHSQHTAHCSSCSEVLEVASKARACTLAALGTLVLTAAVALGRGMPLLSAPSAFIAAFAAAAVWAYQRLSKFSQQFKFVDWHQADLPGA